MGQSQPKSADGPTESTPLSAEASATVKEQVREVEEEGLQDYLGSFICCRVVAPVEWPCLEEHRHAILSFTHILCMIAVVLSFLAFYGGYAHTDTLRNLNWAEVESSLGLSYAGVKWVCWDLPNPPEKGTFGDGQSGVLSDGKGQYWECKQWYDFTCQNSPAQEACNACKVHSTAIMGSIFMAIFSFVSLFNSTVQRMNGKDSNYVKFMAVFSCVIGGSNFLYAVGFWWWTCILSVDAIGWKIKTGRALWYMLIAAVFKVVMGFIHLGLPVEKKVEEKDDKKVDI